MKILVSACLLGTNCKYNGGNNHCPAAVKLAEEQEMIPVCPEMAAGFGCPRTPIEIVNGVLYDRDGNNVDAPMRRAIEQLLLQLQEEEIEYAILKSRSPTCGVKEVYDGTFSGRRIPGQGTLAAALLAAGYRVIDAEDL